MQPSRLPHLLRGLSASFVATLLALAGHIVGGGEAPAFLGIAAPFLLSFAVCVLLAGRKLSIVRLSISVVASQAIFHTLFILGTPSGRVDAMHGHGHHHGASAVPLMTANTIELMHGDTLMWISHFAAAAITIGLLHRGETALHRLIQVAEHLAAWLRQSFSPQPLPIEPKILQFPIVEWRSASPLSHIGVSTLSRRGPPLSLWTACS